MRTAYRAGIGMLVIVAALLMALVILDWPDDEVVVSAPWRRP